MSQIAQLMNICGKHLPRLNIIPGRRLQLGMLPYSVSYFLLFSLLFGTIFYLSLLNVYMSPYASGTDASGYLNFARQLAHREIFLPVRSLPAHSVTEFGSEAFQPVGWIVRDNSGLMSPYYPPGAPIHFAIATWLVGTTAAVNFANTMLTIAAGMLVYLSCRHLKVDNVWAGSAVVALYLCPLFIFGALQPFSELPSLTWAMATLYAAMRSGDRNPWAFVCGAAYSTALLVRPTNILLAVPILLASKLRPKWLAWFALGAMPGGIFLLYLNWRLYGSPFTTGQVALLQELSIKYVPHNLAHFGRWTFLLLGPMVLCSLVFLVSSHLRSRDYIIHAFWVVTLVSFYAFYFYAGLDAWWWLRYLVPAVPSLIILAVAGLQTIWTRLAAVNASSALSAKAHFHGRVRTVRRIRDNACFLRVFVKRGDGWKAFPLMKIPMLRRIAVLYGIGTILILLSIGWEAVAVRRVGNGELFTMGEGNKIYRDAPIWTRDNIHQRAIIASSDLSGSFYYYTDFMVLNYGLMDKAKMSEFFVAAREQGRPIYAVLGDYEINGEDVDRTEAWRLFVHSWRQIGGHTKLLAQIGERHFILELTTGRDGACRERGARCAGW
jgi:hypothetical protein